MQIPILFFVLCGILSVKGSPVETIKSLKPLKTLEGSESLESLENSLIAADSVEEIVISNVPQGKPLHQLVAAAAIVQSSSIFEPLPVVADVARRVGPVELGLQNVVAASAAATEDIYMDMSEMNAETSNMINSKSEILTAHAMNDLYEPLNKVENEIKKTGDCGKRYENALSMVFKDIDSNLKECNKNLTAIDKSYRNGNVGSLTSLSIASEEMNNLLESCEVDKNFAVGTFCVINNLAEMNERVMSDVKIIKQNTKLTEEETQKAVATTNICHKKLVDRVTDKLTNLLKEIDEKCVLKKP